MPMRILWVKAGKLLPVDTGGKIRSFNILRLADDASSFGDSIITLLKDPQLRRRYERTAAALAARYDWSNIARQFEDVLHDTIGATHTAQLVTS